MKTINYTFSVWVTTILLSPIIFLIYMFFFTKTLGTYILMKIFSALMVLLFSAVALCCF